MNKNFKAHLLLLKHHLPFNKSCRHIITWWSFEAWWEVSFGNIFPFSFLSFFKDTHICTECLIDVLYLSYVHLLAETIKHVGASLAEGIGGCGSSCECWELNSILCKSWKPSWQMSYLSSLLWFCFSGQNFVDSNSMKSLVMYLCSMHF